MVVDPIKVIEFLQGLNFNSTYYPEYIVQSLNKLGFTAEIMSDGNGIVVERIGVESSMPEWGDPGIDPLTLLSEIYELLTGEHGGSYRNGRGFWYRDVLRQLKRQLGIPVTSGDW